MSKVKFRASAVGKCAATLYELAKHGAAQEDPTLNPMELFLLMGHSSQSALVQYLSYFGIKPASEERALKKEYPAFTLTGHMDAEYEVEDEIVVGEVKALKDKNYRLVSRGKHWAKVRPEYFTQVQMYIELSGRASAVMFFINRDDHKDNLLHGMLPLKSPCGTFSPSLRVKRDDDFIEGQLNRLGEIAMMVKRGKPPGCDLVTGRCWDCFPSSGTGRKGSRKPLTDEARDESFAKARAAMEALNK